MPSRRTPDLEHFLDGLTTTAEDKAVLHRVRALDHLEPAEYLRFLLAFAELHPPDREIPPRHEPFEL